MKRDITDKGFRAFLETLTWHERYWTSRYTIHPERRIEVLLEQDWDYYDFLVNLTDKEEEPDDYILVYPEIRSALEELDEEPLLHYNLGKLFAKLMMAKADGSYMRELSKIENCDLLIIDDFGLQAIHNEKQLILMDLIEDRHHKKSTIFCSQLPVKSWYDLIEEKTIADAILDRIIHSAIRFE